MPKRIIVCSDGTGNTAIKGRGTNVFKLFEAVDLDGHRFNAAVTPQIAIYDDGVGTEQFKPLKLFGGATGWGLSRNVKHLYKELARIYDPGDEIYMFGFSRGAFTIRTLVGFIATCGLVDPEKLNPKTFGNLQSTVRKAYRAYRKCYRPSLWRWFAQPSKDAGEQFKKAHSSSGDVKVRFVGVWDTVDAVGLPFHLSDVLNATIYQFKFPDRSLSPIVQRACHALAIDDQRQSFHPLMWKETPEDHSRISQVWFAGAHSNVGGGYPKQGMSLVALDWLLTQAEQAGAPFQQHGLRLNANERQSFREHSSVDDKLYDPRAGLGVFYRWKIRDIAAMCAANNVTPKVHVTVLERVAHGTDDYSPGNLPPGAAVVFTAPANSEHSPLAEHRAASVQKVVATIPRGTLLNEVRTPIRIGQLSYYAYLVSIIAVIAAAPRLDLENPLSQLWTLVSLALGFVAAYLMMAYADWQMDQVFSGFWYGKQKELRDNLKLARQEVNRLQTGRAAPAPAAGAVAPLAAAGVVAWRRTGADWRSDNPEAAEPETRYPMQGLRPSRASPRKGVELPIQSGRFEVYNLAESSDSPPGREAMKHLLTCLVCGVAFVMLSAAGLLAQATAQITGTVKDASGGVLPGATVSATQTDTGFKREVVTDEAGSYSFPGIPVGPYKLEVTLQGFRTSVQTGIVLQVNSNPIVPVTLALGEIAETITVQANAQVVETRSLGVGQVMDNKRILDLPLNGRNAADLLQYLPAAVPQAVVLFSSAMSGSGGALSYSLGGGLAFGVAYVLDGTMHNDPRNNLNLPLPFPDALQEFQAETSAMTARNGMHSGAAVSAVTKSGTNSFRGDLFEFFRHHRFNATDPFGTKNPDGSRKDDGLKRNQYGVTIGGPIKTDRLFFFFGYQGTNTTVNPSDNRAFVPTAAMLAGDFTAFASAACNAGVPRNLGAPFLGNRVDPSLFSKAALNITSRLPTTTDPCGLVQYGLPSATDEGQYVTKIDYTMGARHSLFGRHIVTTQFSPAPFTLESAQQNVLTTRVGGRDNMVHTFTLGENWVISPTTLNAVRFASNRSNISRPNIDFFSPQDVGINSYSYLQHYMLLNVTGGFTLGTGTETPTNIVTPSWQISDDLTLVRGGHQYVFGGSFARWGTESHGNVRSPGQFSIDGTQTGLGLADFLLGRMGTNALVQAAPNTLDMEQKYLGLYAQDTWRVGPRLTLNYGVRWEPFFPQQLVNGAVYQFDMARFQAGTKSTVFPNAPAGLYFPGDPGFPSKAGMPTDWNNLGPRVGLAWDPVGDGKTSVRASYGKAFEFVNGQFHLNTSVAPPWGSEVRLNAPPGGLDDPFLGSPGGQTNIFPVTFDQNAAFSLNGPFLSLTNDLESTSVHSFNVTVERQLSARWFATAGYIGSRTNNIWESFPLNNARFIPVPGTNAPPTIANTNNRRPLNLIDPNNGKYFAQLDQYVSDGSQRYNGMVLTLRGGTRLTTVNANYTLSHCYGSPEGGGSSTTNVGTGYNIPSNPSFDDGNCAADRLHNFSLTASIQSPQLDSPAMRAVFSDWRLVGGFRKTTGPWLTVSTGSDIALNGQAGTQRANRVLDDPYADRSINPANGAMRFLNPLAFSQPAGGTLGTGARNSIRGMGTRSLDMSLTRVIRVTDTQDLEVRVDAFNAFNWFQWGQPSTALNNLATFGQITTAGAPRAMQFAIKYRF